MHAFSYAHAFTNRPGAVLAAVADNDTGRLESVRKNFSMIPHLYKSWREMLDKTPLDAVIITSANVDHPEIAIECARRKLHIMCEKPIAITIADGVKMIRAARENNVKFMTAFPVRFSPPVIDAKKALDEGNAGTVRGACTSNHGSMPGGWFVDKSRSGGGAVIDHTVHVADIMRWLLDDEVDEVYAEYANRLHNIPTEDVGLLIMKFRKGAIVSLDTSWSRPKSYSIWGDVKLDIRGDDATISVNCFPRSINHYDDTTMKHNGTAVGADLDSLMVDEFLASIRENREPSVTGEDGLRAVEIALAAYEAGASGKVAKIKHASI